MGEKEKQRPCDTVTTLEKIVEVQKDKCAQNDIQLAVINTKLNLIMWLLAAVGAAVISMVIKMIFSSV